MKKIIYITAVIISNLAFAQMNIGGNSISSNSISLEFGISNATNGYKGVILPWATSETDVTGAVNGTLILDLNTQKIKVKKTAIGWTDLTVKNTTDVIPGITNQTINYSIVDNSKTDLAGAKVSIGTPTSTPGILVLEDTNKAMILPKMDSPHLNIKSPAAGMMAYDTLTNQLALFNGTVWTFWKP